MYIALLSHDKLLFAYKSEGIASKNRDRDKYINKERKRCMSGNKINIKFI